MNASLKPKDVDEYIAATPKELRTKLGQLRAAILLAAPQAAEHISYGMPYYFYKGRLAYFALSKHHIGLYVPTPVIDEYKHELKNFDAEKATIRFLLNKKLPIALIKKLIRTRVKKNEAKKMGTTLK